MKSKIGIMGGTFNPIHNGHIHIAKQAMKEYSLDEIWFVPTGQSPHKEIADQVSRVLRREMCELALYDCPHMHVHDIETNSTGKSYSYLTLRRLNKQYPDAQFYFIIGEDSLDTFDEWVNPDVISANAAILIAPRASLDMNGRALISHESADPDKYHLLEKKAAAASSKYHGDFLLIHCDTYDISSTILRFMIREEEDVSSYIPQKACEMITRNRLYLPPQQADFDEIRRQLKQVLKPGRYEHSLGVMYTACALAMAHGYSMEDAQLAGLLHDCGKYMSPEELLSFAKANHIEVSDAELANPQLLHGKAGAVLAQTKYGVADPSVIHAISVHTTGCPDMSLLDEIIFTADYIEPNRNRAPRLKEIREVAFDDLSLAVTLILEDTISYLKAAPSKMDLTTVATYQSYKSKIQHRGDKALS